jgi:hypothetical protein
MTEREMTNKEVAAHFREWVKKEHSNWSWPVDGCGYNQHVRFAQYRNENWKGEGTFTQFLLDYADKIENEPDTRCKCIHPNIKITPLCYCCDEPSCKFKGLKQDGTRFVLPRYYRNFDGKIMLATEESREEELHNVPNEGDGYGVD